MTSVMMMAISPDEDAWMSTMMSMFSDIMAWVIVLYEQYPALFAMCVQIVLLVVIFMCFGMHCQRTVPLHLRDTSSHDAAHVPQVLDRPLNININTRQGIRPAPGTPGNPLGVATDEEEEFCKPQPPAGWSQVRSQGKVRSV